MTLTTIKRAGLDGEALDRVFTIGASGSSAYTFQGEGLNGTVNNPTLYLTRGKTYRFENGSGGHPIRIQSTSGASGTAYNTGVTNNAGSGTVIVEVQHDAPDVLYYQCTSHAAMNGILYITGALPDGGVTTAKLANDSVTMAKLAGGALPTDITVASANIVDGTIATADIANDAVTTTKIADSQVITAKINDGAVTTAKIADSQITTAKINNSAITTAKIADNAVTLAKIGSGALPTDITVATANISDQAVTLAKLPHGTSSNDGKFLRANNGADPTFETVNTNLVADTTPQLGGVLNSNGHDIDFADGDKARFGSSQDLQIFHSADTNQITTREKLLKIYGGASNSSQIFGTNANLGAELYYNNSKKFQTTTDGYYYYGTITGGSDARSNAGITQTNVLTPATRFFTGGYGSQDQNVTIQATTGNWQGGSSSTSHRSSGILFNRVSNNVQQIRAGIQHDINGSEKFRFIVLTVIYLLEPKVMLTETKSGKTVIENH